MIRIVKASTLASLQDQAALAGQLSAQIAAAAGQRQAAQTANLHARAAEAAQADAEARYTALHDDTLARIARMKLALSDPLTGPAFQAQLALHVLRDQITAVKASGDLDLIERIRGMDALFSQDWPRRSPAGTARPQTGESPVTREARTAVPNTPGRDHRADEIPTDHQPIAERNLS